MIIYSHQSNKMKNRCEFVNNENKVRFNTGLSSFDTLNAVFLQVPLTYLVTLWIWKWRVIIAANFPMKAIGWKTPEKYQGFNGIRTRDLRDAGGMLNQLSFKSDNISRTCHDNDEVETRYASERLVLSFWCFTVNSISSFFTVEGCLRYQTFTIVVRG